MIQNHTLEGMIEEEDWYVSFRKYEHDWESLWEDTIFIFKYTNFVWP